MDDVWVAISALDQRLSGLSDRIDDMAIHDEIERGIRDGLHQKRLERYTIGEKLVGLTIALASLGSLILGIVYHVGG